LLLFTFFSLVYNLNWLSSLVFFSPSPSISSVSQLTYRLFSPIIFSLVLCFPFLIFVSRF
jgi:hypothetical protein